MMHGHTVAQNHAAEPFSDALGGNGLPVQSRQIQISFARATRVRRVKGEAACIHALSVAPPPVETRQVPVSALRPLI